MPSYATLTRAMRARGLIRKRRRKWHEKEARPPAGTREVLSYEVCRAATRSGMPTYPQV